MGSRAHGVVVRRMPITIVSGPAGSGKSALMKFLALYRGEAGMAVVAPTNGAARAAQKAIDAVLPRKGFGPALEVHTTHTGFGVGWGGTWDAAKVLHGLHQKPKAMKVYKSGLIVLDEGAQTPEEHLAVAEVVARTVNGNEETMGGIQLLILMDAVQTPPVRAMPHPLGIEMIWEGELLRRAEAAGKLAKYALVHVYRTEGLLLEFCMALRAQYEGNVMALKQHFEDEVVDETFKDLVHERSEVYPLAYDKHGRRHDSVRVRATARGVEGTKLSSTPMEWPADKQRAIRNESKLLLEVHAYPSQFVRYEPVGRGGARTKAFADGRGGGWYIKKGELMQVTDTSRCGEGVLEVRCPNLLNQPYADIPMEELKLQVDVERGCKRWVTIRGLPVAYDDIGTIYGDQGSENDNVHLHCGKLKPKRNLVYTGATRARKRLKISGLADEQDVRLKMGLHPKSIVYQAELGDSFAPGVVEAARDEVAAMAVGDLHLRQAGAVLALAP
mmetsp:Transcript_13166/g.38820  ORF Transcript_13166/g.38820 Transcript_13166/m.38820 type:complete len:500 (+) Transcript_13166:856-2355(+)